MQISQSSTSDLAEYFMIKSSSQLPIKVKLYLESLERLLEHSSSDALPNTNRPFLSAFTKLSLHQKSHYLCQTIKFIVKALLKQQSQEIPLTNGEIKTIETSAELSVTTFKIPRWIDVTFKLDKNKNMISLVTKKKTENIYLDGYLVRRSKKNKGYVILVGALENLKPEKMKIYLSFSSSIVNQVYEELLQSIMALRNQDLLRLLDGESGKTKKENQSGNTVFLSTKNINDFISYKDKTIKNLLASSKLQFRTLKQLKSSPSAEINVKQCLNLSKLFKSESLHSTPQYPLKQAFLNLIKKKSKMFSQYSQVLQSYSNKYTAVYEKFLFNNRAVDLITVREENHAPEQEEVMFIRGIKNIMSENFLEFMWVKVREMTGGAEMEDRKEQGNRSKQEGKDRRQMRSKLLLICAFNIGELFRPELIQEYLLKVHQAVIGILASPNFGEESQNEKEKDGKQKFMEEDHVINSEEEFYTVYGSDLQHEQFVEFVEGQGEAVISVVSEEINRNKQTLSLPLKNEVKANKKKQEEKIQSSEKNSTQAHLKHRHVLDPIPKYPLKSSLMTTHYLFKEWVRQKNGGVLCTNQVIINEQKKIFKFIITTFGNNILKGGSILNVSLPVFIFKKESHLESIARNFSYAPIFFEGVQDKLERVKFATLLAISVGTLGISMDKPFNPILGETLQLWIGGCPVYVEQISHHPPIGAYYFQGRGFKIYGQVCPKISFGLNNVKGYSERPNYIVFDDGTEIQISFGKMVIYGMLFGDRDFNFEDKIFAYDKTNNIFSEIIYGPKRKGIIISKNTDPRDFIYGKIYRIKKEFRKKFDASLPRIYPGKDVIEKQLSEFQGIWNEIIKFDGKQYVNFKEQLPCQPQKEEFPLPSNSNFRTDLRMLIEGKVDEAQKQKELGEEIQRNDRKLREGFKEKNQ